MMDNKNLDQDINQDMNSVNKEKKTEEEEHSLWQYMPYLLLFTILLFFCVFGITYSIYKGDSGSDNEIVTDQIIFSYSDVDKVGNGIFIQDAIPISDDMGKAMTGKNQYFDFYITASTKKSKVFYQLLVNKDEESTLSNNNVRIYLTKMLGSYEEELVLDNFSNLKQKKVKNKDYYVLYEKTLSESLENYSDSYRLRMWVAEDATNYENQKFSIKIDVYAEQVEE